MMKRYYLHNGTEQQGPYDIEDLKHKGIQKQTPVWHEGLSEWTTADQIEDLKDLLDNATPPPFFTAPSIPQQSIPKKKNRVGVVLQLIGVVGAIVIVAMVVRANMGDNEKAQPETVPQTYEQKVMTVEEIERSEPTRFLTAEGKYNTNFWGDKIRIRGIIRSTATVASFKDVVLRVTYLTRTKTKLGSNDHNIYEQFQPHSEVKFDLKVDNYEDVSSIECEVVKATAIN